METSGAGGVIDVGSIPIPPGVELERWLLTFPSYGFVLSVAEPHVMETLTRFAARGVAAAVIGELDDSSVARIAISEREAELWDFRSAPLIGCGAPSKGAERS
jgi:selenophosphate synthetase-related protein